MSELKYGMRVRNTFRSALERQVGEAVAIDVEQRKGNNLMNSKSEYNRCQLPRITTKSYKETLEEKEKETAEEIRVKEEIKLIRKKKRDKKIEEDMAQPTLKRVCLEIQNVNILKWKKRKENEKEKKERQEKKDEENWTKEKRKNVGKKKKEDLLQKLSDQGKIKKQQKPKKWIEEKKKLWRNYREESKECMKEAEKENKENENSDEIERELKENKYIEEKQKKLKVKMVQSVLQVNGNGIDPLKIEADLKKTENMPKMDQNEPKTDQKEPKNGNIKGLTPLKCLLPIVGGGGEVTTLKVKGGDEKGLTPLKCLIPIVGGGEGLTTLKVKGGDVNDSNGEKGLTPLKCQIPIVGGGDELTTLKVKGGDVVNTEAQALVVMGLGRDWLPEGQGPGVKLVPEVDVKFSVGKSEIDSKLSANSNGEIVTKVQSSPHSRIGQYSSSIQSLSDSNIGTNILGDSNGEKHPQKDSKVQIRSEVQTSPISRIDSNSSSKQSHSVLKIQGTKQTRDSGSENQSQSDSKSSTASECDSNGGIISDMTPEKCPISSVKNGSKMTPILAKLAKQKK